MDTSTLIQPAELAALAGRDGVRTVDTREVFGDRRAGRTAYAASHIPGALYLGWLEDLSDPADPVEGQIAPPARFAAAMERSGISDDTLVVAYDDNQLFQAARLAWMLRYYGHDGVRVLDGGWPRWVREGHPVSASVPNVTRGRFTCAPRPELRLTKDDVRAIVAEGTRPILDCRWESSYRAAGGHIPGARHLPSTNTLAPDGTWRSPADVAELARRLGATPEREVVLYCGGGISACQIYLALAMAGYPKLSVYDGSWSDWSSGEPAPIEPH
jgi:thiosulfate/3-mercaptopyruvate sulfurtransferase